MIPDARHVAHVVGKRLETVNKENEAAFHFVTISMSFFPTFVWHVLMTRLPSQRTSQVPHLPFLQLKGMFTLALLATCSKDAPMGACTFLPPLKVTVTVGAALPAGFFAASLGSLLLKGVVEESHVPWSMETTDLDARAAEAGERVAGRKADDEDSVSSRSSG